MKNKNSSTPDYIKTHFSDYFGVLPEVLEEYGAFNISLLGDLPLFIDPSFSSIVRIKSIASYMTGSSVILSSCVISPQRAE